MELLVHVGWRSAVQNQEIADLVHFLHEIQQELGVDGDGCVMTRIKRLRQMESRLPGAEEQVAALTQLVERLRIQLEK